MRELFRTGCLRKLSADGIAKWNVLCKFARFTTLPKLRLFSFFAPKVLQEKDSDFSISSSLHSTPASPSVTGRRVKQATGASGRSDPARSIADRQAGFGQRLLRARPEPPLPRSLLPGRCRGRFTRRDWRLLSIHDLITVYLSIFRINFVADYDVNSSFDVLQIKIKKLKKK